MKRCEQCLGSGKETIRLSKRHVKLIPCSNCGGTGKEPITVKVDTK